jgi:hypothetical protein
MRQLVLDPISKMDKITEIIAVLCAGTIPVPIGHLAIFEPVRAQGCVDVRRAAVTPRSSSSMARCRLNIQVGTKKTRMKMSGKVMTAKTTKYNVTVTSKK